MARAHEDLSSLSSPSGPDFQNDARLRSVLESAHNQAIEWLNRGQFGGLNYTPGQLGQVKNALTDIAPSLNAPEMIWRLLPADLGRPYYCEYGERGGSRATLRVAANGDFGFTLYRPQARGLSPEARVLRAVFVEEPNLPFEFDEDLLLEFWRFGNPVPPHEDVKSWVARFFPGSPEESLVHKFLPVDFIMERKILPYQAYWTDEMMIDLIITLGPRGYRDIYVARRFTKEPDGGQIFGRRANFTQKQHPKPQKSRSFVYQGRLIREGSTA